MQIARDSSIVRLSIRVTILWLALLLGGCDVAIPITFGRKTPTPRSAYDYVYTNTPDRTQTVVAHTPSLTPSLTATLTPAPSKSPTPMPFPATETLSPTRTLVPRGVPLGWFHFISAEVGWGVESPKVKFGESPPMPRILRTSDAGVSWNDITPDNLQENSFVLVQPFDSLSALMVVRSPVESNNEGYRSYLTTYRTNDGGSNWMVIDAFPSTANAPFDLNFIDTDIGWMALHGGSWAMKSFFELYRTENGGDDWTQVMKSPRNEELDQEEGDLPFSGSKNGISFVDDQAGWVTGAQAIEGLFLYATNDGGYNWYPRKSLPIPPGAGPDVFEEAFITTYPPVFVQGRSGYMLAIFSLTDRHFATLYTTDDGGVNWRVSALPCYAFLGLDFVNPQVGWISDRERLFTTMDRGETWDELDSMPELRSYDPYMDFVDESHGWISDWDVIYKTEDGGVTWEVINPRLE